MYLETTSQPVVLVVPDTPRIQFRKNPKVRFQKPLTRLQLTATRLGIITTKFCISSVSVTLPRSISKTRYLSLAYLPNSPQTISGSESSATFLGLQWKRPAAPGSVKSCLLGSVVNIL